MINVKKLVLFIETVRKAVLFLDRSVHLHRHEDSWWFVFLIRIYRILYCTIDNYLRCISVINTTFLLKFVVVKYEVYILDYAWQNLKSSSSQLWCWSQRDKGRYPVTIKWPWTKNMHIPLLSPANKMIPFVFSLLSLQILTVTGQVLTLI